MDSFMKEIKLGDEKEGGGHREEGGRIILKRMSMYDTNWMELAQNRLELLNAAYGDKSITVAKFSIAKSMGFVMYYKDFTII